MQENGHIVYHIFINATSLAKSAAFQHFQVDLLRINADIGMVTETWLKPNQHADAMYSIDGYILLRRDCVKRKGGGVCAWVKFEFKPQIVQTLSSLSNNNYDLLWFSCQHEALQDYPFHYCLLYLPPPSTNVASYDATLLVDELISDIELLQTVAIMSLCAWLEI